MIGAAMVEFTMVKVAMIEVTIVGAAMVEVGMVEVTMVGAAMVEVGMVRAAMVGVAMVKEPTNRVFAKNLVELRLLQSVSCIKPIPTHEKHLLWEKVAQMPLLT